MKKAVVLPFIIFFVFQFNSIPIFAAKKGGFFVLDDGSNGRDGVTGGSVVLDWRDFEPTEGDYQWDLIENPTGLFVPWIAYWKTYMCTSGEWKPSECVGINTAPQRAPGRFMLGTPGGPTLRFKLRVTEGALPLWIFGGQGAKEKALSLGPNHDGKMPNSTGGTACGCINYCYMPGEPQCHPETDVVIANVSTFYPKMEDNSSPVWWNPLFQQKLKKTLLALGQRIENNPTLTANIEFVEASVGNYGEMILYAANETGWAFCNNNPTFHKYDDCVCHENRDENKNKWSCPVSAIGKNYFCTYDYVTTHLPDGIRRWLGAGYTNKKYYDAIMNILGFYVESFKKLPIALSEGAGLYAGDPYIYRSDCSTIAVDDQDHYPFVMRRWVIPRAIEKWGSKMYLKFAGFGPPGQGGHGGEFRTYCPNTTRCIYESFGSISKWNGWPYKSTAELVDIFKAGAADNAYIIMMWHGDFDLIYAHDNQIQPTPLPGFPTPTPIPKLMTAFKLAAPYLWVNGAISPTPPPVAVTIGLNKGWNTVSWLTGFLSGQTPSLLPDVCTAESSNVGNLWKPFVKTYGGDDGNFVIGSKYPVWCREAASWEF